MTKQAVEFVHQSVRDMAWAIASPPLIRPRSSPCLWPNSHWFQKKYQETSAWMQQLDTDPAELNELLTRQKDRRLGKYFETLWFYWLSKHPRYAIVENNVQINIDGETLGEIDFIVFDKKSKKTMHWELAVKFYLAVGDTREMANWHGPNLGDRLDKKVAHLLQHQSIIGREPRVLQWLKSQGIAIDRCAVMLKGRLYYPWSLNQQMVQGKLDLPPECSPDLLYGCWFKQSELAAAFDDGQGYMPLLNQGWLERIPTDFQHEYYTKNKINDNESNNCLRFPLHVQLYKPCHSCDRAFLVDNNWPEKIA